MGWLPFYATECDLRTLFAFLNNEEETAFLVSGGGGKWMAVKRQDYLVDARYCIWHVPSGPLPLVRPRGAEDGVVDDPWMGWREEQAGMNPTVPYLGPGHPGVIWFNACAHSKRWPGAIGMSGFEWIGNSKRIIGRAATPETERFWKRLGQIVKKGARRIPREGPWDGPRPEIWALPDAMKAIQAGTDRDHNPECLDGIVRES